MAENMGFSRAGAAANTYLYLISGLKVFVLVMRSKCMSKRPLCTFGWICVCRNFSTGGTPADFSMHVV